MSVSEVDVRTEDSARRAFIPGSAVDLLTRGGADEAHQLQELGPAGVGDRAVTQIAFFPEGEVIAVAGRVRGQRALARPAEDIDHVRAMLIGERRGTLMLEVVGAT